MHDIRIMRQCLPTTDIFYPLSDAIVFYHFSIGVDVTGSVSEIYTSKYHIINRIVNNSRLDIQL